MLVPSRKENESIVINEETVVTVTQVRGSEVGVGVEAPGEIPVRRSEVDNGISLKPLLPCQDTRVQETPALAFLPSTEEIRDVVEAEVSFLGGRMSDCRDDGTRLFLRAILPLVREVRPNDPVNSGVAVKVFGSKIRVRHYTFRQVCRNGAIMTRTVFTRSVERVDPCASTDEISSVVSELRDVLRSCSFAEVFDKATRQIRSAARRPAVDAMRALTMPTGLPPERQTEMRREIESRFESGGDPSLFGLMNAITSIARDEPDPELRWRLEELGGSVPSLLRRFDADKNRKRWRRSRSRVYS